MVDPKLDERFDELAVQVHDWTESAVALEAGHFPRELLSDLTDIIDELKAYLEEPDVPHSRREVMELFVTPEMAEVVDRFSRVRKHLASEWSPRLAEMIEDEGGGFEPLDDEEEE